MLQPIFEVDQLKIDLVTGLIQLVSHAGLGVFKRLVKADVVNTEYTAEVSTRQRK